MSTVASITVAMPEVTFGAQTGGSEVSSYALYYNNGASLVFIELTGETTEQLGLLYTVATTPGSTYLFKYKIKNSFGFSEASP
jgi:hypothetical protein